MLLFSTLLERINKSMTKDTFISSSLSGIRAAHIENNIIPDMVWNGRKEISVWKRRTVA